MAADFNLYRIWRGFGGSRHRTFNGAQFVIGKSTEEFGAFLTSSRQEEMGFYRSQQVFRIYLAAERAICGQAILTWPSLSSTSPDLEPFSRREACCTTPIGCGMKLQVRRIPSDLKIIAYLIYPSRTRLKAFEIILSLCP